MPGDGLPRGTEGKLLPEHLNRKNYRVYNEPVILKGFNMRTFLFAVSALILVIVASPFIILNALVDAYLEMTDDVEDRYNDRKRSRNESLKPIKN